VTDQALAQLSNNLVYATLIVLALALVAFCADLAYGSGRRRAQQAAGGRDAVGTRATAGSVSLLDRPHPTATGPAGRSVPPALGTASDEPGEPDVERWARVGVALTTLAFALLLGAVVSRGLAVGRPPWGNMYEFSVAGALSALGVFLALVAMRRNVRFLGVFVVLAALLTLGVAVVVLYTEAAQLVPALKSYWLWIHVTAAIISSGIFTVATGATVMFLVSDSAERRAAAGKADNWVSTVARHLPDASTLDKAAYRAITFGFPLWFFAIMAGAIWAENAWGRYWGWDPKETWSFITLVLYAAYLHARATAGWRGRNAALIALAAYGCFLFNYFGVNIWFFGLHSYGGV
jgi:cytochrome c-type biogenesis protein CcsB